MIYVVVVAHDVGANVYGPFDTPEQARYYGDSTLSGKWYVDLLINPYNN